MHGIVKPVAAATAEWHEYYSRWPRWLGGGKFWRRMTKDGYQYVRRVDEDDYQRALAENYNPRL